MLIYIHIYVYITTHCQKKALTHRRGSIIFEVDFKRPRINFGISQVFLVQPVDNCRPQAGFSVVTPVAFARHDFNSQLLGPRFSEQED